MTFKMLSLLGGLAVLAMLSPPILAQDDPNALAEATEQVDSGIMLARRQTSVSDLTGALGTLERVLFNYPESVPARLLYASLLCRLDDRQGAELELGLLAGKQIMDADWSGVIAACGSVARPALPTRKNK